LPPASWTSSAFTASGPARTGRRPTNLTRLSAGRSNNLTPDPNRGFLRGSSSVSCSLAGFRVGEGPPTPGATGEKPHE
jgi:hypothetical protein